MKVVMEGLSIQNNKGINKPNEDLVFCGENLGCAILLDGVSRDKENGVYPNPSPAYDVSELFADFYISEIRALKKQGVSISPELVKNIIAKANKRISLYNKKGSFDFPAGTVGIVMHFEDDRVLYAYIGDCNGGIVRNGSFELFTNKQTALVAKNKKNLTTKEIRYEICNNIKHPYGYGVLDGNPGALDFVRLGELKIEHDDVVLLYTDGAEPAMEERDIQDYLNTKIDNLIGTKSIATGEERPNSDDQSLIRIRIKD